MVSDRALSSLHAGQAPRLKPQSIGFLRASGESSFCPADVVKRTSRSERLARSLVPAPRASHVHRCKCILSVAVARPAGRQRTTFRQPCTVCNGLVAGQMRVEEEVCGNLWVDAHNNSRPLSKPALASQHDVVHQVSVHLDEPNLQSRATGAAPASFALMPSSGRTAELQAAPSPPVPGRNVCSGRTCCRKAALPCQVSKPPAAAPATTCERGMM